MLLQDPIFPFLVVWLVDVVACLYFREREWQGVPSLVRWALRLGFAVPLLIGAWWAWWLISVLFYGAFVDFGSDAGNYARAAALTAWVVTAIIAAGMVAMVWPVDRRRNSRTA